MITSMSGDPALIIDLIEAFRRSKTMFSAAALGVFDVLHEAPATAAGLAARIHADTNALERLLNGCAALGLLRRHAGYYANEPVADEYLCRSSPRALTGYVLYSNDVLFRLWTNLEDAVREGGHRWKQTFGFEGAIFDHFFQTEEAMRVFLMGMHGFGLLSSPAVAACFDLSRFRRMVDLGGATGHLAMAACERYPNLAAAVFDLPRVIEFARQLTGRIEFIPGDFFHDELPEADLFAAGRILHDWSESKITALLEKIHHRLPPGGGVLIAEKLLSEDEPGPVSASMQSLNMLVCTEGRERTAAEYTELLEAAGFQDVRACRTGSPLDAVMGVKR